MCRCCYRFYVELKYVQMLSHIVCSLMATIYSFRSDQFEGGRSRVSANNDSSEMHKIKWLNWFISYKANCIDVHNTLNKKPKFQFFICNAYFFSPSNKQKFIHSYGFVRKIPPQFSLRTTFKPHTSLCQLSKIMCSCRSLQSAWPIEDANDFETFHRV